MFNENITEFVETFDSKSTKKMYSIHLKPIAESTSLEDVISNIHKLDNMKLSTRKAKKSAMNKFFKYINNNELLEALFEVSDIEIVPECPYFFNVLELKRYIDDFGESKSKKARTYILAYLLFIGIDRSYIRDVSIFDYDETKNIITHNNDIYNISEMDMNDVIKDALVINKYAKAIDCETGKYISYDSDYRSKMVKSLVGTSLLRTYKSDCEAVSFNTLLNNDEKTIIAKSGAYIRNYNRIKSGMDEVESFNLLSKELMRVIRYKTVMEEYILFETKYKEAGY